MVSAPRRPGALAAIGLAGVCVLAFGGPLGADSAVAADREGELEGLEGHTSEPAQYARLAWLCEALRSPCPIRFVAGHEHIAPGRKQDPGPGFDWPRLRQALGWPADQFAA